MPIMHATIANTEIVAQQITDLIDTFSEEIFGLLSCELWAGTDEEADIDLRVARLGMHLRTYGRVLDNLATHCDGMVYSDALVA